LIDSSVSNSFHPGRWSRNTLQPEADVGFLVLDRRELGLCGRSPTRGRTADFLSIADNARLTFRRSIAPANGPQSACPAKKR